MFQIFEFEFEFEKIESERVVDRFDDIMIQIANWLDATVRDIECVHFEARGHSGCL